MSKPILIISVHMWTKLKHRIYDIVGIKRTSLLEIQCQVMPEEHLQQRRCKPKIGYHTRDSAIKALVHHFSRFTKVPLMPVHCSFCDKYHLTASIPKNNKRSGS